MDKIDKTEVKHIAELASLSLTEKEVDRFSVDLTNILKYINQLDEVKVDSGAIDNESLYNIWREDEITNINMRDQLLQNTPDQKDGFIRVKAVFGDS
ncbi:MAG: Asp-tRNA(Asn)/Glu-tRNA(Gln) amidotransferase subunit GatC [Patescibacteria group bacterium]|jgi:aspartyl-tRNA(Asn)/glutamyl-tRNA(Gln) amidotransferase subunit C